MLIDAMADGGVPLTLPSAEEAQREQQGADRQQGAGADDEEDDEEQAAAGQRALAGRLRGLLDRCLGAFPPTELRAAYLASPSPEQVGRKGVCLESCEASGNHGNAATRTRRGG